MEHAGPEDLLEADEGGHSLMTTETQRQPRVPPHNREAEQAVLGAMLFDERAVNDCVEALVEDDFYVEAHRIVFRAMRAMWNENRPVDLVTVMAELRAMDAIEPVGGATYLAQLLDAVPTVAHHRYYSQLVIEERLRRDLIANAIDMAADARTKEAPEEIAARHGARIQALTDSRTAGTLVSIEHAATDALTLMDTRERVKAELLGYSTGISTLDRALLGIIPGKYYVIGARPSQGKTALACQIGEHIASTDHDVLLFSLEMGREELAFRSIARRTGIDMVDLMLGRRYSDHVDEITAAVSHLYGMPYRIDDRTRDIESIAAKIRRERARKRCDVVIVDYLQQINTTRRLVSRLQEVSYFSRTLCDLAKELDIAVIVLSQLSRAVETRTPPQPRLSDLKETGDIEQDADAVIELYCPLFYLKQMYPEKPEGDKPLENYNRDVERWKNLCKVFIAKIRYYRLDTLHLNFVGATQRFSDRTEREAP